MKKILALTSAFIIISIVPAYALEVAQRWDKTYEIGGLSQAYSIQQTVDGGYIVAGTNFFEGFFVMKLDYNGNVTWEKLYGTSGTARSIQQTSDGGYIVSGWSNSGPGDHVLRLDSSGAIIWQKSYGIMTIDGNFINGMSISNVSIIQTHDGGFMLGGYMITYEGEFPPPFDITEEALAVIKLDANGDISWLKKYLNSQPDVYSEYKYPITQTSEGGYVLAGDADGDIWVLKLDVNGDISWQNRYGGAALDGVSSIEETSDNGFIVAGTTSSFGAGEYDFWVFKLDSSGEVIWQKTYGGESGDYPSSIKQTADEGYIVVGSSSDNLWILKLDGTGNISWQKIYLERRSGLLPTVGLTADGGYVISSHSSNPPTYDWKIWVLKLDSNGEIPDCEVLSTTNAIIADTTISAENTNIISSSGDSFASDTDVISQGTSATISSICQYDDPLDTDGDGIGNNFGASFVSSAYNGSFLIDQDNCPSMPNGPFLGVCSKGSVRGTCINDEACGVDGVCSMNQEDTYPPQGNGIGDACDCEGDFNCNGNCDGTDAATFKIDFGRSSFNNLCESGDPCNGDFDCDGDCDGTDAAGFKTDFGRSSFNNPCPACTVGEWCSYSSP